jgi:hypothetical protein
MFNGARRRRPFTENERKDRGGGELYLIVVQKNGRKTTSVIFSLIKIPSLFCRCNIDFSEKNFSSAKP